MEEFTEEEEAVTAAVEEEREKQQLRWATLSSSPSKGVCGFCINDHVDVLVEILKRLDARTLAQSASVCRLWGSISLDDSLWEHLIVRHLSLNPCYASSLRPVVVAMGGYRRLYTACVRPVLARSDRSVQSWDEVQLSLSLFSVDCYERRLVGGDSTSLRFLCEPVNV